MQATMEMHGHDDPELEERYKALQEEEKQLEAELKAKKQAGDERMTLGSQPLKSKRAEIQERIHQLQQALRTAHDPQAQNELEALREQVNSMRKAEEQVEKERKKKEQADARKKRHQWAIDNPENHQLTSAEDRKWWETDGGRLARKKQEQAYRERVIDLAGKPPPAPPRAPKEVDWPSSSLSNEG